MGGTWSGPQRHRELITRQKLQQSTIREIEAIERCVYCYTDIRLRSLLAPYSKQEYPWDILPYYYTLRHLRNNINYKPKNCYHCSKGQLQDHASGKILDRLYNKTTNRCQCMTSSVESGISLEQLTEDESDLNIYTTNKTNQLT